MSSNSGGQSHFFTQNQISPFVNGEIFDASDSTKKYAPKKKCFKRRTIYNNPLYLPPTPKKSKYRAVKKCTTVGNHLFSPPSESNKYGRKIVIVNKENQAVRNQQIISNSSTTSSQSETVSIVGKPDEQDLSKESQNDFSCHRCSTNFSRPEHLSIHLKCLSCVRNIACPMCHTMFCRQSELEEHLCTMYRPVEYEHEREPTEFVCGMCGRDQQFSCKRDLTDHISTHHRKECPICHAHIIPTRYGAHLKTHTVECVECGLSFRRSVDLKAHKLIHSGRKQFVCKICGNEYSVLRDLL
eukprot:898195_1